MNGQAMRAELKLLRSSDFDVETYQPEDPRNFEVWIEGAIGTPGEEGSDIFQFAVCTPSWIAAELERSGGVMFGRYRIVVAEWDLALVRTAIANLCNETTGASWDEIGVKLARYGLWQFSDYQPYAPR